MLQRDKLRLTDIFGRGDGEAVFLLFEGALNLEAAENFESQGINPECLFYGDIDPEVAAVAPYVVHLGKHPEAAQRFLSEEWRPDWGCLVLASAGKSIGDLKRQLRKHTIVLLPSGKSAHFRFYDPRVLTSFLKMATPEQCERFFGATIESFAVLTADPESINLLDRP